MASLEQRLRGRGTETEVKLEHRYPSSRSIFFFLSQRLIVLAPTLVALINSGSCFEATQERSRRDCGKR